MNDPRSRKLIFTIETHTHYEQGQDENQQQKQKQKIEKTVLNEQPLSDIFTLIEIDYAAGKPCLFYYNQQALPRNELVKEVRFEMDVDD